MMARPWAKAIAVIPGRTTPLPTTAAGPAPMNKKGKGPVNSAAAPARMNTKAKVPMISARSFGAIRLDIVDSRGEIDARRAISLAPGNKARVLKMADDTEARRRPAKAGGV